jgi:hypothetical protein
MSDEMADLVVALTTTEYTYISEKGNNQLEVDIIIDNLPVCIAELELFIPNISDCYTKHIQKVLLESKSPVFIDEDIRKIFIGENSTFEEKGLLSYTDYDLSPQSTQFFKRWEETETLLFEYTIKRIDHTGKDIGTIACVSGMWSQDTWKRFDIVEKPVFTIHEEEKV